MVIAIILLVLLAIALSVGGLIALIWGIYDWVVNGFNFWALVWVVIGGVMVLSGIFSRSSK